MGVPAGSAFKNSTFCPQLYVYFGFSERTDSLPQATLSWLDFITEGEKYLLRGRS